MTLGEGGRGAVREGGREKWRDWKVIIGDMLTWQGACNPKPGTQTNTGAHPSIHPHPHAQRERHIPNAIQQDTLYLLCPYKHKKILTHIHTHRLIGIGVKPILRSLLWNTNTAALAS